MFRRSNHSVWDCRYRLVWATKRRRKALRHEEGRKFCERLLRRIAGKFDMYIIAIEVAEEHVHVCTEIPPQLSVGTAVRMYKSLSVRHMVKRFPHLRKYYWGGKIWSPSYFLQTVGDGVTAETVKNYIEMHEERIEIGSVQAKLFGKGKAKRRTQRPWAFPEESH